MGMKKRKRYSVPRNGFGFPRKALWRADADLIVPLALTNSRVEEFMKLIAKLWKPSKDVLLLSPCSNVKPYPLSPLNRKVDAALRRLGVFNRVEWVFISDLLGPVPYEYTWVPPACCYDAPPQLVDAEYLRRVAEVVASWWERVRGYFSALVVFLPKKYLRLVMPILGDAGDAEILKYDIFYGQRYVLSALRKVFNGSLSGPDRDDYVHS